MEPIFVLKQKSQDFIVEEVLPFELAGKGDAFFVFFEKRNLNTMDIVHHLCQELGISRMTLGIAGLKDKKAMTRQWISIYKSALKKMGGENVFLDSLAKKVRIMKTGRHTAPIGLSTPIQNKFYLRLRGAKHLSQEERKLAREYIDNIFETGYPNMFGEQRFGIDSRNRKQGKDILEGKGKIKKKEEVVFKLQAFASKMFNDYLISRTKKGLVIQDGDIVEIPGGEKKQLGFYVAQDNTVRPFAYPKKDMDFVYPREFGKPILYDYETMIPTGPMIGYNLLCAEKKTEIGIKEQALFTRIGLSDKYMKIFKTYRIFGLRRSLRVTPQDTKITFQKDDMLLQFVLPAGAYASVMVDAVMARLEKFSEKVGE